MSKRGYKMVEMVKNKSETGTTAVECKILPQRGLEKQNTSKPSITESKEVKSPQFVLTEFTPEIWLETTDPVPNATGNNIIIECPEDIAEELGISGGDDEPLSLQAKHSENFEGVLEQSNNILGTANGEGQYTNQDADGEHSSHSNESKAADKLSEPSNRSNSSSSDEDIEIAPNTEINGEEPKRKRSLKGQVDGSLWKKNINIAKRRKGEEYEGRKLSEGKTVPILKKKRQLGQACSSKLCSKAQSRYCNEFTQEDRLKIFENFWENMDWGQKKIFVSGLIDVCPPKSRKKNSSCTVPKKTVTLNYHLKKDNKRLSVCKLMFLNTLGIGEWSAREWALKGQHKSSLHVKKCNVPLKPKGNEHLESFLNELPKIPSHYCRSQSSKLYLEPIFKSQKEVFDVYVENCSESKIKPLSLTQFKKFFIKMNIGLFQPKKDQCDLCCMHEVNNISEEKWLEHQQMKEDARREMKADTERAKLDKSLMVITMDLQAVLLCPLLKASAIYRKKKLIFHNFTMFNNVTHEVTCYVWHEGEGNITANEFSSCIVDYIEKNCNEKLKEIILWSDGCTYQNRNSILSNALLQCSALKNVCIIQKILEKGHTQMSCDSVHSVIERKIKNRIISVPADYVNIIETARKNPMPYNVIYLDHTFFKAYSNLKYYSSIRPGKKAGDPVVTDLRALKYNGSDLTIEYKFKMTDAWQSIPQRPGKFSAEKPVGLYKSALGIQKDKYDHLQELTKVLKSDYHLFYKNLKYY
nr:unnamed protein product [Callosobruchus analis]